MRKSCWTPSIVPRRDDQDVYLVVDDLGRLGRVWREADFETTDYESVVTDLLEGQYKNHAMAPTMQIACQAFIAPNSAARSPKQRCTHVPYGPRRHARCFSVERPTRGDGQDWDGSVYWSYALWSI
jgi:hypothetical protein